MSDIGQNIGKALVSCAVAIAAVVGGLALGGGYLWGKVANDDTNPNAVEVVKTTNVSTMPAQDQAALKTCLSAVANAHLSAKALEVEDPAKAVANVYSKKCVM